MERRARISVCDHVTPLAFIDAWAILTGAIGVHNRSSSVLRSPHALLPVCSEGDSSFCRSGSIPGLSEHLLITTIPMVPLFSTGYVTYATMLFLYVVLSHVRHALRDLCLPHHLLHP